jgi:hypothetical protein
MEMAEEETEHRRRLIEVYREGFGEHIPPSAAKMSEASSSTNPFGWCGH